jgi:hypothetical protein
MTASPMRAEPEARVKPLAQVVRHAAARRVLAEPGETGP